MTPSKHGRSALSRGNDARGALGEITISDEAGECGNRLIGTACRRTCAAAGLTLCTWSPPKLGMTTGLWLPSATCPITKSQRDAAGAADKDETEVPAPCSCASTERDEDVVFPALMLLQAWKS